jgi:hypothetical protein
VQLLRGPVEFRTIVVKPFLQEQSDSLDLSDSESNPDPEQANKSPQTTTPQEVWPQRTKRLPARFRQNITNTANDATDADITVFIQDKEPNLALLTAD